MAVFRCRTPKYRHYMPKNLGVVRINGQDHYLGKYDSPESWEMYHRLIADWLANGRNPPPVSVAGDPSAEKLLSVNDVILAYWRFAKSHYVRNDEPTKEVEAIRIALRPVRQHCITNLQDC